jgi:hypothetical protein
MPTRALLLRRIEAESSSTGERVGILCRRLLRGRPREVLVQVDAFMTVYIIWTGALASALVVAAWGFDAAVGRPLPTLLIAAGAGVAAFPTAIAGGLAAVLAWHALVHPNHNVDLDPRKPSALFSVADLLGYVTGLAIALAVALKW